MAALEIVDNSAYEFAHGRSPRGYGSWAFGTERDTRSEDLVWFHQVTFSQARKQAEKWARANGHHRVFTQS